MITNILVTKGYDRGYLPKSSTAVIQPVFATANLAVRREALDEIGQFDINCNTGEDVDLCIRLVKTKWELFFEPRAIIRHRHRTTLPELLKQWYGYGRYHPYIFKKHNPKCLEVYYSTTKGLGWSSKKFSTIFGLPFPLHISIFVTPFHIFNIFFVMEIFSIGLKLYGVSTILLLGWLLARLYFNSSSLFKFNFQKIGRNIAYLLIGYILNWAYVTGAFLGGLRLGVIYIEATREKIPLYGD